MEATRVLQIEGISARHFYEALRTLETEIQSLKNQPAPASAADGYLSRQQVRELLGVSLVTVCDWTNKGFLRSYRLGQKVFYKRAEVDAAMLEIPKKGGRDGKG